MATLNFKIHSTQYPGYTVLYDRSKEPPGAVLKRLLAAKRSTVDRDEVEAQADDIQRVLQIKADLRRYAARRNGVQLSVAVRSVTSDYRRYTEAKAEITGWLRANEVPGIRAAWRGNSACLWVDEIIGGG